MCPRIYLHLHTLSFQDLARPYKTMKDHRGLCKRIQKFTNSNRAKCHPLTHPLQPPLPATQSPIHTITHPLIHPATPSGGCITVCTSICLHMPKCSVLVRFGLRVFTIAILGSILDSQLSWESGKYQLARWSHGVVIFFERTDLTRPTSHFSFILYVVWCPHPNCSCHHQSKCGVPTSKYMCAVYLL